MLRTALLALLAVGVAVAAPVPKSREKSKDEKAFEGIWQVKGYEGGVPRRATSGRCGSASSTGSGS